MMPIQANILFELGTKRLSKKQVRIFLSNMCRESIPNLQVITGQVLTPAAGFDLVSNLAQRGQITLDGGLADLQRGRQVHYGGCSLLVCCLGQQTQDDVTAAGSLALDVTVVGLINGPNHLHTVRILQSTAVWGVYSRQTDLNSAYRRGFPGFRNSAMFRHFLQTASLLLRRKPRQTSQ